MLSFRRDRGIATGIFNGVRTARMHLSKIIPSALRIAGESVFISYPGQPKTCRKRGDVGHLAQGSKNPCCYNCESPGHWASECEKEPLCGICLKSDHPVADCPYRLFSANVANAEDQFVLRRHDEAKPARRDSGCRISPSKESSKPSSQNKSQSTSQSMNQATSQDDSQNKSKKGSRSEEPSDKSDKREKPTRKRNRERSSEDDSRKKSEHRLKGRCNKDDRDRDDNRDYRRDRRERDRD